MFWGLVPVVALNVLWQWSSLPSMPPRAAGSAGKAAGPLTLLKRRNVAFAMAGVMLTFAGAFAVFTYLRPFLETCTQVSVPQLSLLLLGLGRAGFAGTYGASALVSGHLYRLLRWLALALGAMTIAMFAAGRILWAEGIVPIAWGMLNSAVPVAWSAWLAKGIGDEPESGGGLLVAAIQLSIMLGASFGGLLFDHVSIAATLVGGAMHMVFASLAIGNGGRLGARKR